MITIPKVVFMILLFFTGFSIGVIITALVDYLKKQKRRK